MTEAELKVKKIISDIYTNEEPNGSKDYYDLVGYDIYINIDKYLEQVDDIKDKIYIAQACNNDEKVEELIKNLSLTDYENNKYLQLKNKNCELNETINFKILSKKYEFLDDILDMITADIEMQDSIISLSDNALELFKKMYSQIQILTDYCNPYIATILRRIVDNPLRKSDKQWRDDYNDLLSDIYTMIDNNYNLSDEDINKLLYLFSIYHRHFISNYNELKNFGNYDTLDSKVYSNFLIKAQKEKKLNDLKDAFLIKSYGISLSYAKLICERYDIKDIKITNENKNALEMYLAIYQVVNENDPDVLIELYDEFTKNMNPEKDFRRIVVFENDLKKAFARDLNNKVFKTENLPFYTIDGIKIYDAGINFKMIITAIGAYQGNFSDQENYYEYWNSPKIRSHANACSLIGNTNLSMAKIKNIVLGFSSMSDNMLLLSKNSDMDSTSSSRDFYIFKSVQKFLEADSMLNNTRSDYNELVYERRDLNSNPKFFKKNPDYIVFFEEYESFDKVYEKYKNDIEYTEYIDKQKEIHDKLWRESMKAAKNFNIPIVKINREKVAKAEYKNIENMVDNFIKTKDSNLLSKIITSFENSRVGNAGFHKIIREEYFSSKNINLFLDKIKGAINSINNDSIKNSLYISLYKAISEEKRKVDLSCRCYTRKNKQTPGIDFIKELKELELILTNDSIDNSITRRIK